MSKQLTMRDSFWNEIYRLAQNDPDIFVISADMGAPALDQFRENLPDQFINSGIAEQNTIAVAAGMAMEGKKVFAYAIAPFISLRCFEQIKVTLSMMNIPVTIVGVGAGFSYDDSGPTHHSVEDISVLRTLPNMTVQLPCDNRQAEYFAKVSCSMKSPNYIRLDRHPLGEIYSNEQNFTSGICQVKDGANACILATGNMVHTALEVAGNMAVYDVYSLPITHPDFPSKIVEYSKIFTIEEHNLIGGMGSYILEYLNDHQIMIPVKRIGADFSSGYCYQYGGREQLQKWCKIDKESILKELF